MATLKKYPNRPGAQRHQAYYVAVDVLGEKTLTEGRIDGDGEFDDAGNYTPPNHFTVEVPYLRVREKGKRPVWVKARDVTT